MRRNASLSTIFRFSALAVLPLLFGAKGGCSFGGDVPVGQDQDPDGTCSLEDCAGIARTEEAKVCADGSALGRTVCAKKGDGTCFWEFPACPSGSTPPGSCTQEDCAGIGATGEAKICSDGTGVGRSVCTRNAAGQCFWDFPPCPTVDAGAIACTLADCLGKPAESDAKLCPDGTALGRSACVRGSSGVCNWDFPACPPAATADAGCGCVPDMKWGQNGGLVPYQDISSISQCFDYMHTRTDYSGGANASCHVTLLGCGSGLRSGRDIVAFLDQPDVKQAIAAKKVFYGYDSRPVDGTVFRIEVGGAIIDVGSPCQSVGCSAIPAGVSMLVDELRAIDDQELGSESCKTAFPKP